MTQAEHHQASLCAVDRDGWREAVEAEVDMICKFDRFFYAFVGWRQSISQR